MKKWISKFAFLFLINFSACNDTEFHDKRSNGAENEDVVSGTAEPGEAEATLNGESHSDVIVEKKDINEKQIILDDSTLSPPVIIEQLVTQSSSCEAGTYFAEGACQPILCADGAELVNGQCTPTPPQCPDELKAQDGSCLPMICPKDHKKVGNLCQPELCPTGLVLSKGLCIPKTCPPGQILEADQCKPHICPKGYKIFNNKCELIVTVCPKGETLVNGVCQKPECPVGQIRVNGICIPIQCPKGQVLKSGKCTIVCPEGYQTLTNGDLVCHITRCPLGTTLIDGKCQSCKDGYKFIGGQCIKICPVGTVLNSNNECVTIVCPNGQMLINGKCTDSCKENQQLINNECKECINYQKFPNLLKVQYFLPKYQTKYPATDLITWTAKDTNKNVQTANFNSISLESIDGMKMERRLITGDEYTDKKRGGITNANIKKGVQAAKDLALAKVPTGAQLISMDEESPVKRKWKYKKKTYSFEEQPADVKYTYNIYQLADKLSVVKNNKTYTYTGGKAWSWGTIKYTLNYKSYEIIYMYFALQSGGGFDGELFFVSEHPLPTGNICK